MDDVFKKWNSHDFYALVVRVGGFLFDEVLRPPDEVKGFSDAQEFNNKFDDKVKITPKAPRSPLKKLGLPP